MGLARGRATAGRVQYSRQKEQQVWPRDQGEVGREKECTFEELLGARVLGMRAERVRGS